MLESNVWGENSFLFIHTTWIGNDLLKIRKMNSAELILKTAYSSADVSPVVSFPPSFARTFSSKERRLGTRQVMYNLKGILTYKRNLDVVKEFPE